MMYVHVRYGLQKETAILLFDHNVVTVADVLERVAVNYTKNTKLKLVNEHKVQMKKNAMVERGRTYQINRFY